MLKKEGLFAPQRLWFLRFLLIANIVYYFFLWMLKSSFEWGKKYEKVSQCWNYSYIFQIKKYLIPVKWFICYSFFTRILPFADNRFECESSSFTARVLMIILCACFNQMIFQTRKFEYSLFGQQISTGSCVFFRFLAINLYKRNMKN